MGHEEVLCLTGKRPGYPFKADYREGSGLGISVVLKRRETEKCEFEEKKETR